MSKTYQDKAITLKRIDIKEADRLFVFYTKEHGKVEAVARGVKKINSKMAGHLEPLGIVDLMIARGKSIDQVAGAARRGPASTGARATAAPEAGSRPAGSGANAWRRSAGMPGCAPWVTCGGCTSRACTVKARTRCARAGACSARGGAWRPWARPPATSAWKKRVSAGKSGASARSAGVTA